MSASGLELNQRSNTDCSASSMRLFGVRILAFILVVGAGYWMIEQKLFASRDYLFADDVFENENVTVDAIDVIGAYSAPTRLLLGMLGVGLMLLPTRGEMLWWNAVWIVVAVICAACCLSILWSINPRVTIQKLVSLILMVLAAAGAARQFSLVELAKALSCICVMYIGLGVLAEVALGTFHPLRSGWRLVGTSHPNTLAVYASICCLAATIFFSKDSKHLGWGLFLVSVGMVTLMLTKSRTTMLALFIAYSSLGYLRLQKHQRWFVMSLILMLASFGGIFLALQKGKTIDSLGSSVAMGRTENIGSLTGRLPLWEELGTFIEKKPILGHGYLAFWDKERVEYLRDVLGWEIPHGHNMYVDIMIDGGVVGLCLFVLFFLVGMASAIDRYRVNQDPSVAFCFSLLVFAMVHGTGESLFKLPTFITFTLLVFTLRMGGLPRFSLTDSTAATDGVNRSGGHA
jgi:exopolysaccharide production protein ExoQ